MKIPPVCVYASAVLITAIINQSAALHADELNAQAESGGGSDSFHIEDNTTNTLGSITAFWSGTHGTATSTSMYGSLSLSVHSVSDGAPNSFGHFDGGTYGAGIVDFGDGSIEKDYWIDSVTIAPTLANPAGTSGTLQITYNLSGSFSTSGVTSSPPAEWNFITNGMNIRHIEGLDSNHIGDYATFTDTIGFTYGTPFTVQAGISADGFTNGSQGAAVDIQLALRETKIAVISGGNSIDFSSSSKAGSAAGKNVSLGGSYAGFTLQNTSPYSHGSTVSILGGTASADKTLGATFTGAPAGSAAVASDIVDLSGPGNDMYVLELSYDPATAVSLFGSEANMKLVWFNGSVWANAVEGDSDGGAASQAFTGAYDSATEFALGNYGVDTVNHVVWAVIDHNSDFSVGQSVPEPGTWATLGGGLAVLTLWRRRRAR